MLDLYGIVFTSVIMLIVIVRALQADRIRPWFQSPKRDIAPPFDRNNPRLRRRS